MRKLRTLGAKCESVGHLVLSVSDSLNPVDYSLSGSSVQGILQGRILEWVVISFSTGLSKLSIYVELWKFVVLEKLVHFI